MSPARILILTNRLGLGGGEVFAASQALGLDRRRFAPSLCYFHGDDTLLPLLRDGGIPVTKLHSTGRFDGRALSELYGMLRDVDILQTHLPYSGIIGRLTGRLARVPVIVSTEQNNTTDYGSRTRYLNDATLGLADAVVCISQGVMDSVVEDGWVARLSGQPLLTVIPNGVDLARTAREVAQAGTEMRARLGLAPEHFVIGNVGRLEVQKGQKYLVDAMPRVLAAEPRARCVIVGKGPLADDLKAQVERLGLGDRVLLLGERSDVLQLLTAVDVFAFPSDYEGLGVVLLEAMAVGCPAVASRIPGIVDVVVDGETGLLVPRRDPAALADALVALARDPARRRAMSAAGRRRVEEVFGLDVVISRYDALYTDLLERRAAARTLAA